MSQPGTAVFTEAEYVIYNLATIIPVCPGQAQFTSVVLVSCLVLHLPRQKVMVGSSEAQDILTHLCI